MRSSCPTVLIALFAGACPAFAHKLQVDPTIVGDTLRVEAYYDDDTPAPNARVFVRSGDQLVAEGRTDEKGVWSCPKPAPGTYLVTAQDVGHASNPVTVVVADPTAAPDPSAEPDSAPTRADKTRTPWRRLGLGLGLIVGVVLLGRLLRRPSARS